MRILQSRTLVLLLAPLVCLGPGCAQKPSHTKRPPNAPIVYVNRDYGFRFYLPASWAGYKTLKDEWGPADGQNGPEIIIRHPLWTDENPREDIPIMVFTRTQWRDMQSEKLIVTAAPFPPGELGRNRKFVFAVLPRWYYDLSDGWEEALKIVGNRGLQPFEPPPQP